MKNLASLICLIVLISFFSSCDGRDRVNKSPETVLTENKLLDSFSEQVSYIPESYAEKTTDTIYTNGYRVYIKQYTNNLKEVTVNPTKNSKTIYKDFNVDLKVTYNDKILHEKTLNTSTEAIYGAYFDTKDHNYILRNVWTNAKDEYQSNSPHIILELYNPITLDTKRMQVTIEKDQLLFT